VTWDYTAAALAWPALNSVTSADLTTLDARYDQVLLSSTKCRIQPSPAKHTPPLNGVTGLISDDRLSTLFSLAVAADSGDEWTAAMTQLATSVGVVPSTVSEPASVLIAIDRGGEGETISIWD